MKIQNSFSNGSVFSLAPSPIAQTNIAKNNKYERSFGGDHFQKAAPIIDAFKEKSGIGKLCSDVANIALDKALESGLIGAIFSACKKGGMPSEEQQRLFSLGIKNDFLNTSLGKCWKGVQNVLDNSTGNFENHELAIAEKQIDDALNLATFKLGAKGKVYDDLIQKTSDTSLEAIQALALTGNMTQHKDIKDALLPIYKQLSEDAIKATFDSIDPNSVSKFTEILASK